MHLHHTDQELTMHEAKAEKIKEQIDNGDQECISWSELWQEFTGLQDGRQLAALNRLQPGKLLLLMQHITEALPIARKRALEDYRKQAIRDGIDLNLLVSYLTTGEIDDENFNNLPSNTVTSPDPKPEKKTKRVYASREEVERRTSFIEKMLLDGKQSGEIVKAVKAEGFKIGNPHTIYSNITKIRAKLKTTSNQTTTDAARQLAEALSEAEA